MEDKVTQEFNLSYVPNWYKKPEIKNYVMFIPHLDAYNNTKTRRTEYCTVKYKCRKQIGDDYMRAINYTNLRENMKTYMDKVTDDYETMIITRKDNKNVVMLSEESYNNLIENNYVMRTKANYDWLMESKAQLEKGETSIRKLHEIDEDE